MRERSYKMEFHSAFGQLLERFVQHKRICGYRYRSKGQYFQLRAMDRFFSEQGLEEEKLTREIVDLWCARRPCERSSTHSRRKSLTRQFALFLCKMEIPSFVPVAHEPSYGSSGFVARIFTREEIRKMFTAADMLPYAKQSPRYHIIMPEVFRLLYSCGLRVGEARKLRVKDVDLSEGILTILDAKFGKDRLVPMSPPMTVRLRRYASNVGIGNKNPEDFFFPAPDKGPYHDETIYAAFRRILYKVGISHGGRGNGPRVHDFRHTFAVHRMVQWCLQGEDLAVMLPILSTYMGHRKLSGTQRYLQLTADLYPDITARNENAYGHIIPKEENHENY